ncbi:MAG: MATE family efflux transporter [Gammaproteobacteria bacterium]|nr:MATE family efflux transporter [Gammaproteobacteria bacterium]
MHRSTNKHESLSDSKVISGFLRLSFPLIATYLIVAVSGFVGVVMLARLGKDVLAATALGFSIYNAAMVFLFGFMTAVGVFIAQQYGARNSAGAGEMGAQGFILAVFLGVVITLVLLMTPLLLRFSGQNNFVVESATKFLTAFSLVILPLSILMCFQKFLMAVNKAKLILYTSIVEAGLEVTISYVLIFGKCGLPRLGIAGLGYGIAVAIVIIDLYLAGVFVVCEYFKPYRYWYFVKKINFTVIWEMSCVGMPVGFLYLIGVVVYICIAFMMGHISTSALAAHQIARQYSAFTLMFLVGLSQAAAIKVGHAVGRGDQGAIRQTGQIGILVGMALMLVVALGYIFFAKYLVALDINIHSKHLEVVTQSAVVFLIIAGVTQFFDVFRTIMMGSLRGLKDTKWPMIITGIAFIFIALPVSYILGFQLKMGGEGLWLGLLVGSILCGAILTRRFYHLVNAF